MIDKIFCMDCLEGMKQIPDGTIDAVICDLPYEVLNKGNECAQWDRLIPFEPLWEQYLRVCKLNAPIILFCQGMFTAQLLMSQPKLWRYNLVWKKGGMVSGFLNAEKMPLRNHEDIAIFYRKLPTYNPQKVKGVPCHNKGGGNHKFTQQCYGKMHDTPTVITDEKYPISIIDYDRDKDAWHPTQKPVDLLRYLVLTYTNEGDTVLDNCSGSGTTAVACVKEKRHFICFEKDETYWKKSVERVKNEKLQLTLF